MLLPGRRRRQRAEWRAEPGPGYQLREYHRGVPTGQVAVIAWPERPDAVALGPEVWLICRATRLEIGEHRPGGQDGARLRLPYRCCTDLRLTNGPGLPGTEPVRLSLSASLGGTTAFTLALWFPAVHRPLLEDLARRLSARRPPAHPAPSAEAPRKLVPLEVSAAPDTPDWLVFRPGPDDGVLSPRPHTEATGESR
ncbi:hypothetical protein [Amycolatopsis sp. 195334CR]|uniref:hypothetical protein n=1 Tax=Amycolatopsis sp. 195334CR TaxID=2814588 RepID=UPI001A8E01FF|nr:hypothetical protein [Amycolatopsis sp. 195334CR]MBN6039290.1 hypothetical protein [Amycolatopsis sp. 195334CR]